MPQRIRDLFSEQHILYALFGLSLIAHLVVFFAMLWIYGPYSFFLSLDGTTNNNDTQHYVILADNLAQGNGYSRFADPPYEPDALRTPLLSLYFMPFTYIGGFQLIWLAMLLLNIVLATAPIFLYKLARSFLSHAFAAVAGIVFAFEPLYVYRSQIAEPDALFVLIAVAAMYFLVRAWQQGTQSDLYIAFGLMGISILAKPTGQYLAAIMLVLAILFDLVVIRGNWWNKLKRPIIGFVILCAVVSPWVIRNYTTFGVAAISSIQGYNLYEYYTKHIALPNEKIPEPIATGSREPSRYLLYQTYFTNLAFERIRQQPSAYMREHVVGVLRNLFVTDISAIYYYGHTGILPFSYNPESQTDIRRDLLSGNIGGIITASPKVLWAVLLGIMYVLAVWGWVLSWRRGAVVFTSFTLFLCLYGYLIVASGPYVDAKYRLPGLLLVVSMALYSVEWLKKAYILRWTSK